jgi:molybdate transport system ATP-binding protein
VLSQYGDEAIAGVSSLLTGRISAVADDGLAYVAVADQKVEVMCAGPNVGDEVGIRLWARDMVLARTVPADISARNALHGKIVALSVRQSGQVEVAVQIGGQQVVAMVMSRTVREMKLAAGQAIVVLFKSASLQPIEFEHSL